LFRSLKVKGQTVTNCQNCHDQAFVSSKSITSFFT
jgi:hypothetical protein